MIWHWYTWVILVFTLNSLFINTSTLVWSSCKAEIKKIEISWVWTCVLIAICVWMFTHV